HAVERKFELLVEEREPCVAANAATRDGVIVGAQRRWRYGSVNHARGCYTRSRAGEDASAESADDAKHLVVAPAGLPSAFDDEVGRVVVRVVGLVVEQAAEVARRGDQGVLRLDFSAEERLRPFHGKPKP